MVLSSLIRPAIRYGARAIYQALKVQDRIIDKTYRKAGLYNRGVVKGIQHGLAGGQIIGGIAQLGLNAPDTPGNGASVPFKKQPKTYRQNQTRNRYTRRFTTRCRPEYRSDKYQRPSRYRKY